MQIIPVLDIRKGCVVRGVAGRREEYRPIVSQLTPSTDPLEVAHAFRDRFGFTELYLADLDAIVGAPPSLLIYQNIQSLGCRLLVDAGIRNATAAAVLLDAGLDSVVAGLETIAGPEVIENLCRQAGPERVVFSLDLMNGKPLGNGDAWKSSDPLEICEEVVACGIRRLIILDLARVGAGSGPGTEVVCKQLARKHPDVEVIGGGGIATLADLNSLKTWGLRGVLIASALHDGRLRPADLIAFRKN